jgi:(S)-sulfolactate dehydrogenase
MDILITEYADAWAVERLTKNYSVGYDETLWKNPDKLRAAIAQARIIVVRNQTQLTAERLAEAENLIGIGRIGVGLDNIDVPAASRQGVVVIAPLDANAMSVAEFTLGLLIALTRKIPFADRSTKAGGWDRKGCTGIELHGKTLAICGFGRIGRLVAARAQAFGMRVLVFDPLVKEDLPALTETQAVLCARLEDALAPADFVSTHTPLTPETRRMFDQRAFAAMKRGAFFINTSRGGVVDEPALLDALQDGHLSGAALDVRETEPPSVKASFEEMNHVILTPHIGSYTVEAHWRTLEAVVADVERLLQGEATTNFVNFSRPRNANS